MTMKPNSEKCQDFTGELKARDAGVLNEKVKESGEKGFSLIEITIAMVIFLIAIMGVFISFAYAINYNSGNSSRAQALALLQQEVEQMRSKKFVPTFMDPELVGGTKPAKVRNGDDNNPYRIQITIDDDPSTPDVVDVLPTPVFKQISVTVSLEAPTPGWQSSVPATVILRRVRGN